jgi:hypothetical protein
MASPNRWAREGEQGGEMGGGEVGSVLSGGRKMGVREGPGRGGRQHGPWGRDGSRWRGRRRQLAVAAEAGWQTGKGGRVRLRCGMADRCGRVATGPSGQRRGAGGREKARCSSNSVLNRFKNIQRKFKFLQILDGSKYNFPCSKILK